VSDRLEQVHRGLGEMQALAQGVGDLKKVLTNVKTRGTWGEVQLEMLLEQMLTPEQYDKNVETVHGTGARVEFAIRLPGKTDADHDATVWLPIDAKFPKEQYERLLDAQERADADAAAAASRELEVAVRKEAQTIHE
ncbi:DNA recombination protein RmuC, partial [Escherichia coli]|nr:DNA recombination protein RmuC [Escherichia coli]